MSLLIPGVPVTQRRHSHVLRSPLAARRFGVMLHYDDSTRDDWAVEWFDDPRCTNGYTWLVLDDGRVIELADPALRTPHAGACRVPMANSAFYGMAAATNGLVPATAAQVASIVEITAAVFRHHGWPSAEVQHRIVGHDQMAIWTPATTRAAGILDARGRTLWGRLGRKVDPTGQRRDGRKILDVLEVHRLVQACLVQQPPGWQAKEVRDAA